MQDYIENSEKSNLVINTGDPIAKVKTIMILTTNTGNPCNINLFLCLNLEEMYDMGKGSYYRNIL